MPTAPAPSPTTLPKRPRCVWSSATASQRIPVSSTKPIHGHALGAGGAIELVVTLLAMRDAIVPPTINWTTPDPRCDIDCVPNLARVKRIRTAMSNSFAFGGINAVLLVGEVNQSLTTLKKRVADLSIGPIEARIEAAAVEAYRQATSFESAPAPDGAVPATFPAIWLWHPQAAAAVAEATRDGARAPVLVAQRFEYRRAMRIGQSYRFTIARYADPDDGEAIDIEADVRCLDGTLAATFSASYRLFASAETTPS